MSTEPADSTPKTTAWILKAATAYLAANGVDAPQATAEHLMSRLFRCKRAELVRYREQVLPEPWLEAMRRGMKRLAAGEPIQYVIGQWDFRDFTLKTDARALIPRPETEQLVDLVLASAHLRSLPEPRLVDWGTGSGCIALALARAFPNAHVVALDISQDALDLARENARLLGLEKQIHFISLAEVDAADIFEPATIDAIISNPPYIPTAAVERLEPKVLAHEPRIALDGGTDGMDVLRLVSDDALMLLNPGGEIFFELDAESNQAQKMTAYLSESGYADIRIHRDDAGTQRFLSATLPEGI
ncbi:MAG: peptide chain release factor N(5)-glutamine methyltransferase [Kiritimatiellia bacterium]